MARIFGWEITKKPEEPLEVFAPEEKSDGASIVVDSGVHNTFLDMDGTVKNSIELITRYRELSLQPEIESAIDDIINEMIAYDDNPNLIEINLDGLDDKTFSPKLKDIIRAEYQNVVNLYDFNHSAYEIVRRWYIDGRLYYYTVVDLKHIENGIQDVRYIDPRKLRKVRVVKKVPGPDARMGELVQEKSEYYLYTESGKADQQGSQPYGTSKTLKISSDSIVQVTSGLLDPNNSVILSYLHKASKPLNQLRAIEDASVINRLVRAPLRRVFNVEVGTLPKAKAEQYLRDQMVKYKNRLTYDASSGAIKDNRHFMTMLEDYWFAKRAGNATTTVDNLQGGDNFSVTDDLAYFLDRLYRSLNVPISRLKDDSGFNLGRPTEITRDELKFSKFISRLRLRFSGLLSETLKKQLILKKVITPDEAELIFQKINFDFKHDVYFTELKETEMMNNRVQSLIAIDPFVGKYFSRAWVKAEVLRQSEEEVKTEQKAMDSEVKTFGPPQSAMQDQQMGLSIDSAQLQNTGAEIQNAGAEKELNAPPEPAAPAPAAKPAAKAKSAK